jgi:hypothetical protein
MTWARLTLGKSSRNALMESPASRQSVRFFTGTRVPAKTGMPPRISGSDVMSRVFTGPSFAHAGRRDNQFCADPIYPIAIIKTD